MINSTDHNYLAEIRAATLTALREVIGQPGPIAILDAPNQRNVGDSLIWAGELAYLNHLRFRLRYLADIGSLVPDDLRRRMPSGTILIHGGGNFGDIWRGHQDHREFILKEFPDYRIVQLPQSMWFSNLNEAARANATMSNHPDFTALLRDTESLQRAADQLPGVNAVFCHDMAFGFTPRGFTPRGFTPTSSRPISALILARSDKEGSSGLSASREEWPAEISINITDWVNRGVDRKLWDVCRTITKLHRQYTRGRRAGRVKPLPMIDSIGNLALRFINDLNIRGGARLYRNASIAVVDRLHAHILACLVGVPHVLLDNNYGKLGAIYRDYSGSFSTAHYAADLDEARALVNTIVAQGAGGDES